LISEGIDEVKAYGLAVSVGEGGNTAAGLRNVLVSWKSGWGDKLYQVYVDGCFAGRAIEESQRKMVVSVPRRQERAVRIEVYAVIPEESYVDFSEQLESGGDNGRIRIRVLREQGIPLGAWIKIYWDSGSGDVDYSEPVDGGVIAVWPDWSEKAGFGMGPFGEGDFGYESGAAVGFGRGHFGLGAMGIGADSVEWLSGSLESGYYKFGVKIADRFGQEGPAEVTGAIAVVRSAEPVEAVGAVSQDAEDGVWLEIIDR